MTLLIFMVGVVLLAASIAIRPQPRPPHLNHPPQPTKAELRERWRVRQL